MILLMNPRLQEKMENTQRGGAGFQALFFSFFFGGWQNFDLPHVKSTQTDQRADFIPRHAFLFGRVQ